MAIGALPVIERQHVQDKSLCYLANRIDPLLAQRGKIGSLQFPRFSKTHLITYMLFDDELGVIFIVSANSQQSLLCPE